VIAAAATERLPHPVAFEAVVTRHLESRTVAVMPADSGGQAGRLWSRGYRALAEAEGNWRSTVPTPWGHVGRRRQVARGAPGEAVLCGFGFRRARRLGRSWFPCRRWVRLSPWIGTRAPFWAAGFTAVGRRSGSAAGHSTPSHFSPSPGPGVWLRRRIAGRRPSGAAPALLPPWLRHTDASRISAARPTQDTQIHTPGPATSSPASVAGRPQNEQAELLRGLRPVRRRRRGFNVR
jgi:hypothetical protein